MLMIELNLENNKYITLSIPDPLEDVTKAAVVEAAEEIVAKNAISAGG
ncbi:DUF2922 domain-containing protein [Selenomonas ruminantium]|nr:DUF2922 domain-containing protein [Selenomonas ruminantium]